MENDQKLQWLADYNDEALTADGFDDAIIVYKTSKLASKSGKIP